MLTGVEAAFLTAYRLTPQDVFDGTRMSTALAKEMARKAGQPLMLGTPCREAGHRLRTRAGHCLQCDPKKLAFLRRGSVEAYIYVLGSKRARLFKIGSSDDVKRRVEQHNRQGYGGATDWRPIWHMRVADSGQIEFDIHAKLARYLVDSIYIKDGVEQATREVFRAPLQLVFDAVLAVIGPTVNEGVLSQDYEAYVWEK